MKKGESKTLETTPAPKNIVKLPSTIDGKKTVIDLTGAGKGSLLTSIQTFSDTLPKKIINLSGITSAPKSTPSPLVVTKPEPPKPEKSNKTQTSEPQKIQIAQLKNELLSKPKNNSKPQPSPTLLPTPSPMLEPLKSPLPSVLPTPDDSLRGQNSTDPIMIMESPPEKNKTAEVKKGGESPGNFIGTKEEIVPMLSPVEDLVGKKEEELKVESPVIEK